MSWVTALTVSLVMATTTTSYVFSGSNAYESSASVGELDLKAASDPKAASELPLLLHWLTFQLYCSLADGRQGAEPDAENTWANPALDKWT